MVFTDEHRQEVQERLKQESESGKVAAPAIAKALGEVWKGMSEEEKDVYRQKSKDRAEAAAAAAAEEAAAAGDQEQQEGGDAAAAAAAAAAAGEDTASQAAALPKHIVKRIMLADDEVQRVSADALWLVAEAGRLFLQQLAVKGAAAAASKKRKTIKLEDFEHVVRTDKRLVAVGLKDVVSNRRLFELHGIAAALGGKQRSTPAAAKGAAAAAVQKQQEQQEGAEPGAAGDPAADGDADRDLQQEEEQQLTDEERIALEEAKRKKAAEAAKARAAKAAERKVAKASEMAKDTHKITTFFVSNKPDQFV
ncbi:hypothetical protein OEZ85_012121 [Tetradesmus obliquus]|uniref:HMG box domain-containing protein n=1 Tax=Tetradesmus obliquus TaxID=3088 RepID=A0ABY8TSQ8_TETOB|nr:hypothetical protein OEZ85_012121 [Tetradesmus obliquus]